MECAKCEYKTEDNKDMVVHLKEKHNIEYSSYDLDRVKSRDEIKVDNLTYYELELFEKKGKIIECKLCSSPGLKGDISYEEFKSLSPIKTNHESINLRATKKGIFKDDMWFCPKCSEHEKNLVKHWDFVEKLKVMQTAMTDEISKSDAKLINASIFTDGECEEYERILIYKKKVKGKQKQFYISACGSEVSWSSYRNDIIEEAMTPKESKEILDKAKTLWKAMVEESERITVEHNKKLDVFPVSYDEDTVTYRKGFYNTGEKHPEVLFVTMDYSDYNGYEETVVEEVTDSNVFYINDWAFESLIMEDGSIKEYLWELKKSEEYNSISFIWNDKKLSSEAERGGQFKNSFELAEALKKDLDNFRKLFSQESNEAKFEFAGKEFVFFADLDNEEKEKQFCFQWRESYSHKPFSEPVFIGQYDVHSFIRMLNKMVSWLESDRITIPGKINKVGENSRHVILDKTKGLKAFFGRDVIDEIYYDEEINVTYEKGRMTITKRDS
jgi:hypothetical protein